MFSSRFWLVLLAVMGFFGVSAISAHAQDPVKWTASLQPVTPRAGEVGRIVLDAKIKAPWWIYAPTTPRGGPVPASFEIVKNPALAGAGKVSQSKPIRKFDHGFGFDVEKYIGQAHFELPVKFKAGLKGPQSVIVKVTYQACNARLCLPPKTIALPVKFTPEAGAPRPQWRAAATTSAQNSPPSGSGSAAPIQGAGLFRFAGVAFVAGLLALFTPCVFPMIPITVSLFSKRENEGLRGPLVYCLGIIGTFTAIGIAVSVLFGAAGLSLLAANPFVNIALALLFVGLALNLFGVFEIIVPAALLQKAQPNGQSGLLAPLLMGFAFTLTSFTCTVPFVGTTLVTAATAGAFYPVIGMLAFSTAFALPFFLLALFPRALQKLPRSGQWLVTFKAFLGFLELAAALKFLSTADYSLQLGYLTRPVFLAIWFALATVAGLYLLRWIRLAHDDSTSKIGPTRRFIGLAMFGVAAWLLAAQGGASLHDLNAFLPPRDYGSRTETASRWLKNDLAAAQAQAKAQNKPLLINFTGYACTNCRLMENDVLPHPDVVNKLDGFVPVELFTDGSDAKSRQFSQYQQQKFGTIAIPLYAIVTPDGKIEGRLEGLERDPAKFAAFLQKGSSERSARTGEASSSGTS